MINITEEDYDYFCMFVHLSPIEKFHKIGNLIKLDSLNVIETTSLETDVKGFIYKNNFGKFILFFDNKNTKITE